MVPVISEPPQECLLAPGGEERGRVSGIDDGINGGIELGVENEDRRGRRRETLVRTRPMVAHIPGTGPRVRREPAPPIGPGRCRSQSSCQCAVVCGTNTTSPIATATDSAECGTCCPAVSFAEAAAHAKVAELAYALDLGSSPGDGLRVRLPPFAHLPGS